MLNVMLVAAALAQPATPKTDAPPVPAPAQAAPLDWVKLEAPLLTNHHQLTHSEQFVKAGEAYFNPASDKIIFQAIATPAAGNKPEQFYQEFEADLAPTKDSLAKVMQLSAPGSANTCGWFSPVDPNLVLFGTTFVPPSMKDVPGYQRSTGRYVWQFHTEMRINFVRLDAPRDAQPRNIAFDSDGYTAEGSWSKDGRFIIYAQFDRERSLKLGRNHLDIKVFDTVTKKTYPLITSDGYNGGPFFSPDGQWICYRSDRKGDDLLQIFVAKLRLETQNGAEVPVGITQEYQLTSNESVNWAPFWHPSGKFLIYGTSEVSHSNYEIFAVEVDKPKLEAIRTIRAGPIVAPNVRKARITYADGADVLPVFNADGSKMMWTSQRGPKAAGEEKSSSQLWIADFKGDPFAKQDEHGGHRERQE